MRIAFFTAGTIGAGHLTHALAIEAGLQRAGFDGSFQIFGPGLPFFIDLPSNYTTVVVKKETLRDRRASEISQLAQALQSYDPHLLIVDMFWAPLAFILPLLECPAWLLIRKCPPQWLQGPSFLNFDAPAYDRILAIEPMEHPLLKERLEPIVLFNPDEIKPPGALRRRLGVADDQHLSVVMQAGLEGEVLSFSPPSEGVVFRSDPHKNPDQVIYPIANWLLDADQIFCGAGYNAYWEARWLGYAHKTTFKAFERPIDDQAWRLRVCSSHTMKENGADQLAQMIL